MAQRGGPPPSEEVEMRSLNQPKPPPPNAQPVVPAGPMPPMVTTQYYPGAPANPGTVFMAGAPPGAPLGPGVPGLPPGVMLVRPPGAGSVVHPLNASTATMYSAI